MNSKFFKRALLKRARTFHRADMKCGNLPLLAIRSTTNISFPLFNKPVRHLLTEKPPPRVMFCKFYGTVMEQSRSNMNLLPMMVNQSNFTVFVSPHPQTNS